MLTGTETVRSPPTVPLLDKVTLVCMGETVGPCGNISALIATFPEKPFRLLRVRWTCPEDPWAMVKSPVLTSIWKLGITGTRIDTVVKWTRLVALELVTSEAMTPIA